MGIVKTCATGMTLLAILALMSIRPNNDSGVILEASQVNHATADGVAEDIEFESVPRVVGWLAAPGSYRLGAGIDVAAPYADITSLVRKDGRFEIGRPVLEHVYGDALIRGRHVLHLEVAGLEGRSLGLIDVPFVVER